MSIRDRYPDANILAQRGHWDDATRHVVLDRVFNTPEYRYFDQHQQATLEALCALVIPQTHRQLDRRVPIGPWIDARCAGYHEDGFRFEDMPSSEQAWTAALLGIDQAATALFGECFKDLSTARQVDVLERIRAGDPPGDAWLTLPARRWWVFVALRQITAIYYAHPYAWDEIGFGGPAYPRGYFALNFGYPETWEAREVGEQAGRSLRPRWRFP